MSRRVSIVLLESVWCLTDQLSIHLICFQQVLEDIKLKVNVGREWTTGFMREYIRSLKYSLRLTNLNHSNHLFAAFKFQFFYDNVSRFSTIDESQYTRMSRLDENI